MIYLCRHSETEWNRENRLQGHLDSNLTLEGRHQAKRLGQTLKVTVNEIEKFTVICSPLPRTRVTAEIICTKIGRDPSNIIFDDRLIEISWGEWESHTRIEIERRWPGIYEKRRKNKWEFKPPNGESYAMLNKRVEEWLKNLSEHDRLIVVTHGATGRVIRQIYGKMSTGTAIKLSEPQDAFFLLHLGEIKKIPVDF